MRTIRSAERYAKALLTLAVEQKQEDVVRKDMDILLTYLSESRELRNMMLSPVIKPHQKKTIIKEIFSGSIGELTMSFLVLLIGKHREMYLKEMSAAYLQAWRAHKNIKKLSITSAHALREDQRKQMIAQAEKWANSSIEVEERVDPDLIGGFVLRLDDRQIDASILTQINELKSSFDKNLYIPEF